MTNHLTVNYQTMTKNTLHSYASKMEAVIAMWRRNVQALL